MECRSSSGFILFLAALIGTRHSLAVRGMMSLATDDSTAANLQGLRVAYYTASTSPDTGTTTRRRFGMGTGESTCRCGSDSFILIQHRLSSQADNARLLNVVSVLLSMSTAFYEIVVCIGFDRTIHMVICIHMVFCSSSASV